MVDFFSCFFFQQKWERLNFLHHFNFFPEPGGDEQTVAAAGGSLIKLWEMSNNRCTDSGKITGRGFSIFFFYGLSIIFIGVVMVCRFAVL